MKSLRQQLPDFLVYFAAMVVALSFGFSYGNVGNQETYLPHALNHLDPGFLRYDWLVQQTDAYHPHFEWIIRIAATLGSIGWITALLNVFASSLTLFLFYKIAGAINSTAAVPCFLIMLLFVLIERTATVGGSALLSDGLQPSTLATLGWAFSILFFLKSQSAWSGLALALAGLFHTNFLILGIGMFGLAQVLIGRAQLGQRLAWQVIPSMIALIPAIPIIIDSAGGEGANLARQIFQHIRSPHHYIPKTYLFNFLQWSGWLMAGGAATWFIDQPSTRRAVQALLWSIFICVVGATLLTTVVFVPTISQLYVWRIAPFGVVLSQLLVAILLVEYAAGRLKPHEFPKHFPLVFVALGYLLVIRWNLSFNYLISHVLLGMLGIVVVCIYLGWSSKLISRRSTAVVATMAAILAATYLPSTLSKSYAASTLLSQPQERLYAWVRSTSPESVFLVPPEMGQIRIRGGRAVIVDWKSTPIRPAQLIEWRDRMEAVVGSPIQSVDEAKISFRKRSLGELRATAARFGATYIIIDSVRHVGLLDGVPIFESDGYSVYDATNPPVALLTLAEN